MAGIQTSRITTDSGDDLTIQPAAGKKTLLKSVDSTNPGATPLATKSDGEVAKLDVAQLEDIGSLADPDADWIMIQDVSDSNKIKKIKAGEVLGGGSSTLPQPPFGTDLPVDGLWLDEDTLLAVQAGGSGSTADLKNSVEFAVVNQTFNQSDKNITVGQSVYARWMNSKLVSANHGQIVSGTLYAKSGSSFTQTWNLTISKQPTGGWDLVDLADQPVSTSVTSALATPTGINVPSPITIDGGTLTSIQVSVNGGAFTSSPGNIKSGQTIAVRGTTGASNSTGYTALISIGGLQETWTVTTVASAASVATPSITSPINGSADLGKSITALSSAYSALNGAGSHLNSDWELKKNGVVVSSSMASTTNKTSWTIPSGDLEENTAYTIRVRYRSSDSITSSYSAESTFETGSFAPPKVGAEIHGGHFAGLIDVNAAGIGTHYIITASKEQTNPKRQGHTGGYATDNSRSIQWGINKVAGGDFNFDSNPVYGAPIMRKFQGPNYPAFHWCQGTSTGANGATYDETNAASSGLGGYNDWYVPARWERTIEIFFFYAVFYWWTSNDPNKWKNPYSVSPYEPNTPIHEGYPGMTTASKFQPLSSEAFYQLNYWCANEPSYPAAPGQDPNNPTYLDHAIWVNMGSMQIYPAPKNELEYVCRVIRRVPV